LREIPLSEVRPNLESGDSSIQSSVSTLGLLSVPVLQPAPTDVEYEYRIVDGRRRIEAATRSGREVIDAYVIPPDVGAEADALTFLLNLARSPSPLREAEALSDLVDSGYTPESLARLGPSLSTIKKRLRLASAPRPIKEGVRSDQIAEGVAEKVANLSGRLQDLCVEHYREAGDLRHKDVTEIRTADRNAQAERLPDNLFEETGGPEAPRDESTDQDPAGDVQDAMEDVDASGLPHEEPGSLRAVGEAARSALESGASPEEVLQVARNAIEQAPAR
jgi:ParB-like chromosome segregation protein Spo0J